MASHTTLPVQQPQATTYNHPSGDLFDEGRRSEYLDTVVPLYRASIKGDLEVTKAILQDHEYLVRYSITENKDTPLHVATVGYSTKLVSYLVNMMSKVDLELQNGDGNTAFCLAAISGNVGIAKIMVEKNQALPIICGSENTMPLYLAAFHGNRAMVIFLYDQSDRMTGNGWTNDNRNGVLLKCIQASIFDVALRIMEDNEELPQDKHAWDVMQVLARNPRAFHVRSRPIISQITSFLAFTGLVITRPALKESSAALLLRLLWKRIMKRRKDVIDEILKGPLIEENNVKTYPSQILFIAAQMNNKKFLVELIHEYPDLIWKRNDDGQTIFHIAVAQRYRDSYSLLYEIGSWKDLITPITDKQGNNILHLVGKNPENNVYSDLASTPFQLNREYVWYKEVEAILPPPCREVKNAEGQTPQELFIKNHKALVLLGAKWINETVHQSMVVAALVCTIGFSVVCTVPGGFDQNNGFPIFLRNKQFTYFILLSTSSFICSTCSIIIFLSIILSRHQGNTKLLLIRWGMGQLLLLSSVVSIVFAFVASILVLYRSLYINMLPYLMYEIVCLVSVICITAYFSLLDNAKYLFRPKKHMLYNKK